MNLPALKLIGSLSSNEAARALRADFDKVFGFALRANPAWKRASDALFSCRSRVEIGWLPWESQEEADAEEEEARQRRLVFRDCAEAMLAHVVPAHRARAFLALARCYLAY